VPDSIIILSHTLIENAFSVTLPLGHEDHAWERKIVQNQPQSRKQSTAPTCVRPSGTLLGTCNDRNRLIPSPELLISPETSPESTLTIGK